MLRQSCRSWLWSEPLNAAQYVGEQVSRDCDLRHLEGNVAPVAHDLAANLYQPVSQRRQRPVVDGFRQREGAQEVTEVVGERMQLKPHSIVGELATGQSCPPDGVFAFLDVLLRRATLIVEDDDPLGWPGEVGHNEADPGIKFTRMPFDLGDNPARLGLTGGPVTEVRVVASHLFRWPADRALQEVGDIAPQDCVRR